MTEMVLSGALPRQSPKIKLEGIADFKFFLFDDNFPMIYKEPKINCDGCPAPCCVKFSIPLTPRESRCMPEDQSLKKSGIHYLNKKLGEPCPFLIDLRCSIWDIRPIVCREYSCEGDSRCSRNL